VKCDRCGGTMDQAASIIGSPMTKLCETCTIVNLERVLRIRCNKPVDDDWCCLSIGHDGGCVPREKADR